MSSLRNSSKLSADVNFNKIVSDELYSYIDTYMSFWALMLLSCFGLTTNTLNTIVFVSQGFKDGVNISLMSITFWDFVKCFSGLVHRMYGPISLFSAVTSTSWKNLTYPYLDYTPVFSSYVAYALTSYVSVERCLCVCKPFEVKAIFTPKFTLVMVVLISVCVFGAYIIIYFLYEIYYAYNVYLNSTVAFYRYDSLYYEYGHIIMPYYKLTAILIPTLSFMTLCTCSAITVYQLKRSANIFNNKKHQTRGDNQTSGISQREKLVAKMLLVVIVVNIGNLFPRIIFYIGQLVEPEFYVLMKYHNFFMTIARFLFVLDFTNACVHFFIFLSMSSNFRSTFYQFFGQSVKVTR
ncbi:G-protein coupled receptor frpr-1 [Biomphalaria glabrata]|nr:G-protein coupled receptor frpr-1 [Biomphalaria glabrata]